MRAFRIAYDGRPFHGFQRQPSVPTVEDAIFDALDELGVFDRDAAHRPDGYAAAGRTDAGVSALAQTVAFEAPDWLSPRALDAHLPETVRAWAVADASEGFHATHDAARRAYVYHLHAPAADPERARTAAARLSGSHDFHNLTPDETGTRRDLDCRVEAGRTLRIHVAADGFPRQLVRRLVAVVRAFAVGECDGDRIDRLLSPTTVDGPEGVAPARPEPLLLTRVDYPELSFTPEQTALADARELFRQRRRRGLASAGVADSALDDLE